MRTRKRALAVGLILSLVLVATAVPAGGTRPGKKPVDDDVRTANFRLVGSTGDNRPAITFGEAFFTDAAFQDDYAYQGTWNGGFRIVDISRPQKPKPLAEVDCGTFQGDIGVYEDLVFRSIDTPVDAETPEETCDAAPAAPGFEGIQIFEVRKARRASADDLVAAVATDCGSHTHTVVPDPKRNRVLLYVSASATSPVYDNDPTWGHECAPDGDKFQIVEVPLDDPEDAQVIADVPLEGGHSCHDIGVLLTKSDRLAVCAGMEAVVFDISDPAEPQRLRSFTTPGVTGWHSAALSWDGDVTVMGWEPGGGVGPECEAGDPALFKSIFFFETATGRLLGTWVLPRPQSAVENCTIHNYNVVPVRGRDVLVAGNYQAGTWVVDFTDPRRAKTLAWSDPLPVNPSALTLGGAWGSYWYNGFVYQSDITKGLKVFKLKDKLRWQAEDVDRLNPQTQIWPEKRKKRRDW
jgi:LVIVD repeat